MSDTTHDHNPPLKSLYSYQAATACYLLDQLPDPVPARETPTEYFNRNNISVEWPAVPDLAEDISKTLPSAPGTTNWYVFTKDLMLLVAAHLLDHTVLFHMMMVNEHLIRRAIDTAPDNTPYTGLPTHLPWDARDFFHCYNAALARRGLRLEEAYNHPQPEPSDNESQDKN